MKIETIAENNLAMGATTGFTDVVVKRFKCVSLHSNAQELFMQTRSHVNDSIQNFSYFKCFPVSLHLLFIGDCSVTLPVALGS
jgi:hypothetical protein